ncbi:sigma-70 family RNA polymerase sigma factor [Oceanispirochaeta sp.]|uniref:RNA polymerase sigma factor n=1 Tax=Oceanispirochaeta sp. TaxID=2035350 RepID=UPI00263444B3|nr:sigma-70 family RNA polymerase sigma factor [Oceanispirochaeta sp.]MDA3958089.1 sigma-70 family RNA polymerase sigma factor [Oceanispirochaeta sp.]
MYIKYGPMVLRRCRSLLKDEDLALDAMQDVFVKLISKQDKLKENYPSSLLYTIATNHCLNIIRKEKKMSWGDEILDRIVSTEVLEEKAVNKMFLDQIFNSQKASTRTIAVLHYRDGLTLEETAEMTSLSVSGVRRRLRKLREAGFSMEGR